MLTVTVEVINDDEIKMSVTSAIINRHSDFHRVYILATDVFEAL